MTTNRSCFPKASCEPARRRAVGGLESRLSIEMDGPKGPQTILDDRRHGCSVVDDRNLNRIDGFVPVSAGDVYADVDLLAYFCRIRALIEKSNP